MKFTTRTYSEYGIEFGTQLKKIMDSQAISIGDLAFDIGLDRMLLTRIIVGDLEPTFELLKIFAEKLNTDIVFEPKKKRRLCRKIKI